jgi:hypothetical protein
MYTAKFIYWLSADTYGTYNASKYSLIHTLSDNLEHDQYAPIIKLLRTVFHRHLAIYSCILLSLFIGLVPTPTENIMLVNTVSFIRCLII